MSLFKSIKVPALSEFRAKRSSAVHQSENFLYFERPFFAKNNLDLKQNSKKITIFF